MTQTAPSPRHMLGLAGRTASDITAILDLADRYDVQNTSAERTSDRLKGKMVVNMFFEPSTRTRTSFEIAAKRLGADVINISIEHSSTRKGETLLDTARNVAAMQVDAFVMRHRENGAPHIVADGTGVPVLNAGDGSNEHPTQALLDALAIRRKKGRLEGLTVAICGDIEHSRVARSNIHLLKAMGATPRIIAPPMFMPKDIDALGVAAFDTLEEGIKGADAVMMLRIQHERLAEGEFAMSLKDYHQTFGLDHDKIKLAKPDVLVLHPGPINRGVELTDALADDPQFSVILYQVQMGVAVRMACLDMLVGA